MRRPRVLLAEDHAETAERLRGLLSVDFDVLASVQDGAALVAAAEQSSPDVIVADIALPGIDGLAATARIRRTDARARIVLVSLHDESTLVAGALAAGALGYVLTNTAGDDLVAAVHAALEGRRFVSGALRYPTAGTTGDPLRSDP